MFQDRIDAGRQLAEKLEKYRKERGIILAIPRGGVPVAWPVAEKLGWPLELLYTKKLGHPANREFAIGAVSLTDSFILPYAGVSHAYIKHETESIRTMLKVMQRKFSGSARLQSLEGKTLIVVDDGIATGNTLLSTINMLKKQHPARIVIAVPVAFRGAAAKLGKEVDDFISVTTPDDFYGVGGAYEDFHQVPDEEVLFYLDKVRGPLPQTS